MQVHFWSEQSLRIYNAFHKVEANKLSNQILQIQTDDENLNVMGNRPHYLQLYLAEMYKQDLCKMKIF